MESSNHLKPQPSFLFHEYSCITLVLQIQKWRVQCWRTIAKVWEKTFTDQLHTVMKPLRRRVRVESNESTFRELNLHHHYVLHFVNGLTNPKIRLPIFSLNNWLPISQIPKHAKREKVRLNKIRYENWLLFYESESINFQEIIRLRECP